MCFFGEKSILHSRYGSKSQHMPLYYRMATYLDICIPIYSSSCLFYGDLVLHFSEYERIFEQFMCDLNTTITSDWKDTEGSTTPGNW